MTCSLRSKILCCIPLLTGCSVIGAICSLTGLSLLFYTLFTLPIKSIFNLKPFYYTKYTFFLTTLTIYYVGLIFAGCLTIYGSLRQSHTKMFSLLAALIAHPFLFFSYKYVYFNDLNIDHYKNYEDTDQRFFETYGINIFIIGTIVAAYFAFCIANGIEMIKTEHGERLIDASEGKKSTLREFLENYCFVLYIIGIVLLCFAILSALASVDVIVSIIEQNDKIQRDNEARFTTTTTTTDYWDWFTTSTLDYWKWYATSTKEYTDYTTASEGYFDKTSSYSYDS